MSPLSSASGEQEHLAGDELVAALVASLSAACSSATSSRPSCTCCPPPCTCGSASIAVSSAVRSAGDVGAGALEQRLRAVGLGQHRGQQVGRLDVGVVVRHRQALGVGQGLLELGGEFVDSHGNPSSCRWT